MSGQIPSPDQSIADRDYVLPDDDEDGPNFDLAKAVPAKTSPVRRKAMKAAKSDPDPSGGKAGRAR
ncbi:MAG: hypothetical protein AAF264_05430 [Pseudomonadota bacterium]